MRRPEAGIIALAILASACAVPTDAPNWDMTWNLPMPDKGNLNIGVASFVPAGVTTVGTPPTAFRANLSGSGTTSIIRQLGADCTTCTNGTAPKPAFTATPPAAPVNFASGTNLNAGLLTTGSQIVFAISNGYSFDPIRPNAGSATTGTGSMTLTVTNGTATLGTTTLLGTATALPPGQTTTVTIPLVGTITGASPLNVSMTMTSPAGSTVAMNLSSLFSVIGTPTIIISTATVTLAAQPVNAQPDTIDLSNLDSAIVRRIADSTTPQGAIFLTLTNPFTIGGNMVVNFSSPAGSPAITPIAKNVPLVAAANGTTPNVSTVALPMSGQELRSILGHKLLVAFTGTTGSGLMTVTPTQKVVATGRLQVTAFIKEP